MTIKLGVACGLCSVWAATLPNRSLLLDVVVNGNPIGKIGDFQQINGNLLATRRELVDLGLKPGSGDLLELLPLTAVPSVSYRFDEARQTGAITAPASSLRPTELWPPREQRNAPTTESATGVVLNYDATASVTGGRVLAEALLDARLYSPWGVATTSFIGRIGAAQSAAGAGVTAMVAQMGVLSLAAAGSRSAARRSIADSFAIVDTDGTEGVQVSYENRPVQRTGPTGRVLVTDLRSFESNRLSIDPTDVPLDAELTSVSQTVRPQDRSGVVVRFPIRHNRSALLLLVDPSGKALPLGSRIRREPKGVETIVGYGGEALVNNLQPHNRALVTISGQVQCRVEFDYHPVPGSIPSIGPLTCKPAME